MRAPDPARPPGPASPEPYQVRPARREDLPRVLSTEAASFSTPWSRATFEALLPRPSVVFRVLVAPDPRAGEIVAGHGVLWAVGPEAEVANVAVAPSFRGTGGGALLLDVLLGEAALRGVERVFLEVRRSNHSARQLYRSRGFEEVGVRPGYYTKPREDALVLALDLQPFVDLDEEPRGDRAAGEGEGTSGERDDVPVSPARPAASPGPEPPGGFGNI